MITVETLQSEITKLHDRLNSKDAYIKALEDQCQLADNVIKELKRSIELKNALETIKP